jgi:hypothetical protein
VITGVFPVPRHGEDACTAARRFGRVTCRRPGVVRLSCGDAVPVTAGMSSRVTLTFTPGPGLTPKLLGAFLTGLSDTGVMGEVILWPEPYRHVRPERYHATCWAYAPVIRAAGFTHAMAVSPYAVLAGGAAWWPGGELIDTVAVVMYASGLGIGPAVRLARRHGAGLGVAELGVSSADPPAGNDAFLGHVLAALLAWDGPGGHVTWLDGAGEYALGWRCLDWYRRFHDDLAEVAGDN